MCIYSINTCIVYICIYAHMCVHMNRYICVNMYVIEYSVVIKQCVTGRKTRIGNEAFDG